MTRPELLRRWMFVPPGWTWAACEMDVRVGGKFRWAWNGPYGTIALTISEYLSHCTPTQRNALEKLRNAIRAAAPQAEECISYSMPAFRLDGRILVYYGAAAKHCSFFPGSSTTVAAFTHLLTGHDTSKGTIRFPPDAPLSSSLVRILVKARIAELAASKTKARRSPHHGVRTVANRTKKATKPQSMPR